MKKGDFVRTPRFCKVKIQKVFRSQQNAFKPGYTVSTDYKDYLGYQVYGKHTGPKLMIFAAVKAL
ncbi:hypothetical protein C4J81_10255 [Deltaproteobacteria bacterium Smac51]|nr:hypothetical protein C4J81_10255 [Deltaproteobacteria bacterium Smac51]